MRVSTRSCDEVYASLHSSRRAKPVRITSGSNTPMPRASQLNCSPRTENIQQRRPSSGRPADRIPATNGNAALRQRSRIDQNGEVQFLETPISSAQTATLTHTTDAAVLYRTKSWVRSCTSLRGYNDSMCIVPSSHAYIA